MRTALPTALLRGVLSASLWLMCSAPLDGFAATAPQPVPDVATPAAKPAPRPNIVFVIIDDAGFSDFGSYGSEISTPNIDAIAQSGVRFTNFHTASTCEASRAMMHSGVDNHLAGAGTLQVTLAENQKGKPGYEGYLSDNVHSIGQLMHDGGYATYFAGKWNLGTGLARAPGARGWDRYLGLEQTGADNFEAKVYAPFNMEAVWWEDGHRAVLPPDFYSSRHYVDKMIRFIEEGRGSGKPFFSIVAFQAVHSPLQAPDPDIEKYMGRYDGGWEKLRAARYAREVQLGLVPAGLTLPIAPLHKNWDQLSAEEQRSYSKKMAVYAGMLDNADQNVGRLRDYLAHAGLLDNTVFIVMSDNGADAFDLSQLNLPFHLWYEANYALGYESLGSKGSYTHYGQDWAEVSNTPFALFKGTSAEGGMRVPFIVDYPGHVKAGTLTDQFAYVTDFLPTVLDIAGIPLPGDEYHGKKLVRPTGTSLLPYLEGRAPSVHTVDDVTGFESTGGQAIFRGEFKLMRNGEPESDNVWRLYNVHDDPAEAHDLAKERPDLFAQLMKQVDAYNQRNGVVLPEPGYNPLKQVLVNNWRVLVRQLGWIIATAAALVLAVIALVIYALLRWRRRARAAHAA